MSAFDLVTEARRLGEPSSGDGWRRLLWQMADTIESLAHERDTLIAAWPSDGSRCVWFDGTKYVAGDSGQSHKLLADAVRAVVGWPEHWT